VTTILVARFRVLVVPPFVMRIARTLVMPAVGLTMLSAAVGGAATASMLGLD
jgi:hypothetical protein